MPFAIAQQRDVGQPSSHEYDEFIISKAVWILSNEEAAVHAVDLVTTARTDWPATVTALTTKKYHENL
jgi:hypothetical protein